MINDRLLTLLGGLISILLVIALLIPQTDRGMKAASTPTSEDRGAVGLSALSQLLKVNNIPVISLRNRYQSLLFDLDLSDNGNVIIINQPLITVPSAAELDVLDEWLAQGNFALILVAREDKPGWVERLSWSKNTVLSALGYRMQAIEQDKEDGEKLDQDAVSENDTVSENKDSSKLFSKENGSKAALALSELGSKHQRIESKLLPMLPYPVLDGVNTVFSYHSLLYTNAPLRLSGVQTERYVVPLLKRHSDGGESLWTFRHGEGGGWVSSQPDLFGNVTLGKADNAKLLSNMLNAALSADGMVIFDDMHLGLSDLYDPDKFFRDTRLHTTLWLIALLWLIYLLAYSNRIAPLKEKPMTISSLSFVEAMAGYFARKSSTVLVAEKLFKHFENEVKEYYRQADSSVTAIYLLSQHAAVNKSELNKLKTFGENISDGKSVNLQQLIRAIDRIKYMMSSKN